MAVMSDSDRRICFEEWMRENASPMGAVTKAQLRAAFDGLDAELNAQASAFNAAIPQPARAQLTTQQKAHILMAVIRKRYLTGA